MTRTATSSHAVNSNPVSPDSLGTAQKIRTAGLRATATRVAVLSALHSGLDHPRVDEIREYVESHGTHISTQAAYDACEALDRVGLVRRLSIAGEPVRYDARAGDNHHHMICRSCGTTVDIDCARLPAPCLDPVDDHGFLLDEAEVTYWGLCPECQTASATGSSGQTIAHH